MASRRGFAALAVCLSLWLGCESRAEERPSAAARPPPAPLFDVVPAWLELSLGPPIGPLSLPVHITSAHDGTNRLFVVEQRGLIRIIDRKGADGGVVRAQPFFDAKALLGADDYEQGLLGLAFHPSFKANGRLFIAYTDDDESDAVAELRAASTPGGARDAADPKSLRPLFAVDDFASNHNGGHLAFSKDGTLFIGTGDGGGAGDPKRTAQDPHAQLGKMLVLDVDKLPPSGAATPSVRFVGLRNPWRYAFDALTGDLWIGDVGQNLYEEVDFVDAARLKDPLNFGWSRVEGAHCFRPNEGCDGAGTEAVAFEYPHGRDGCSVTGGVVFRSKDEPFADGTYVVGDYCSGRMWIMKRNGARFSVALALSADKRISSFGTDDDGGVWITDHGGNVYRVHAKPLAPPAPAPAAPATPAPTPPPSPPAPATK